MPPRMLRRLRNLLRSVADRAAHRPRHAEPVYDPPTTTKCSRCILRTVPVEVLFQACAFLDKDEIQNLSLTCSDMRSPLLPLIFHSINVDSIETLAQLAQRPHITCSVQVLSISLHNSKPKADDGLSRQIVDTITCIISQGGLGYLHTLRWGCMEMPRDDLWTILRESCLHLRNITVEVGSKPLDAHSSLWAFSGLTGFELKASSSGATVEELPARAWNMLLFRCPHLQVLDLKGSSSRLFDCTRVTEGHWSGLRKLALSATDYDPALQTFFRRHRDLESLDIEWVSTEEHRTSTEATDAEQRLGFTELPHLQSFTGNYHYAIKIIPNPSQIHHLDLSYTPLRPRNVPIASTYLSEFSSLVSLTLCLSVYDPEDITPVFPSIVASCPKLALLHIVAKPGLCLRLVEELSSELQRLPRVREVVLSDTHQTRNMEFVSDIAGRIARKNPHLARIRILRERPDGFTMTGVYDVDLDNRGVPMTLIASEIRSAKWFRKVKRKNFKYNIAVRRAMWDRPYEHPVYQLL